MEKTKKSKGEKLIPIRMYIGGGRTIYKAEVYCSKKMVENGGLDPLFDKLKKQAHKALKKYL